MKTFILIVFFNIEFITFAQQVSKDEISKIAINFYSLIIDTSIKQNIAYENKIIYYKNYPCLNLIKYFDNNWVLITNDKRAFPILAYSNEKSFSKSIPQNVQYWFNNYAEEVLEKIKFNDFSSYLYWDNLISGNNIQIKSEQIGPLINSKWGQSSSNDNNDLNAYNFYAPSIEDNSQQCNHALAGCPATAAGQIIKYWQYPPCVEFNYNNMPEELIVSNTNYISNKKEIANLLRNIADKMNDNNLYFGCNSSGTTKETILNALKNDFSFYDAQMINRDDYSINEWKTLLINEIKNYRPILYMGSNGIGGHAFICDGYKDLFLGKKFHFNFGWNGDYNGYYRINNPQGYSNYQSAIIHLHDNNCNSYKEINWYDKFSLGSNLSYYNPIYGTIYSSPTFVIVQNNEIVHYKAYNEIILENFYTEENAEFIAENIACYSCNFINYKDLKNDIMYYFNISNDSIIKIFPNPFSNKVNVVSDFQDITISLINIYGNVLITEKPLNFFNYIDLSYLTNGIYILQIKTSNKLVNVKIIKQ